MRSASPPICTAARDIRVARADPSGAGSANDRRETHAADRESVSRRTGRHARHGRTPTLRSLRKAVYNLSEMAPEAAAELLERKEPVCVRVRCSADGTLIHSAAP